MEYAFKEGQKLMRRASKKLGTQFLGGTEDRRFRSYFGVGAHVCSLAWNMMMEKEVVPPKIQFKHYLWALMFMKLYPANEIEMCVALGGIDPKTMRKHVWPAIGAIFELHFHVVSLFMLLCYYNWNCQLFPNLYWRTLPQILWENRKRGDTGNDCLISNDGTDLILAMKYLKELHSYKFKHAALRYEVGLGIKTGDICWWNGPFEPGLYNDEMIFKMGLRGMLEDGERIETDMGYRGSAPMHVKCPGTITFDQATKKMQQNVRCRQETVNKRLKQWNILMARYRHDLLAHQKVFGAIISLTQLSIENGEPLYGVEYNDV